MDEATERKIISDLRAIAAELGPDFDGRTALAYCAGLEAGWPETQKARRPGEGATGKPGESRAAAELRETAG